MTDFLDHFARDLGDHWLIYGTMPLIMAVIGYVTKLVAVRMMLGPLDFRGIPPYLGWQGIIPRYAPRMATSAVDLMLDKLISPQELLGQVDPDELVEQLRLPMLEMTDELTRRLMAEYYPTAWEAMPETVRRLLVRRVQAQVPAVVNRMVRQMQEDISSVLDLRTMAIDSLVRDKSLLVRLVQTVGKPEMHFIVRSGLIFGFFLGFGQAVLWAATHEPLLMPAFGFFVGYFTDWLALNMVFRPIQPRRYLGVFRWQGMFHRRREQVAVDYANMIAAEIMSPRNLIQALLNGPQSDRLLEMIDTEVRETVERQAGVAKPLMVLSIGGRRFQEMKADAARIAIEQLPRAAHQVEGYAEQVIDLRSIVVSKMNQMTAEEYEGLLRPAFKQDEWKLVFIGGVLGAVIGELQVLLLLH